APCGMRTGVEGAGERVSRRTSPATPIGDRHNWGGWAPHVPGWVGRPADRGKSLAAIVVRATAAGKAMRVPPVQQAAPVGEPSADWPHPLQEAGLARLAARWLPTKPLAAGDQCEEECPDPRVASHGVHSPVQ